MSANASAFQALAAQPAALEYFARNMPAFAKLGADANFPSLVTNSAFAAAARSGDLAQAVESN